MGDEAVKLLDIDVGTTSICGVVVDTAVSGVVDTVTRANDSQLVIRVEDELQDANRIMHIVEDILSETLQRHREIRAIGVSGQMHGIVYVNAQGMPVSPLYTWRNNLGTRMYKGEMTYADSLYERTGYRVPSGYGLLTHYAHVFERQVPKDAVALCTIADYVTMRLSGLSRPVTDVTLAASLGLFDERRLNFDVEALDHAGIELSFIPEVAPSCSVIGRTRAGIAVTNAIGDNQAAHLGSVRSLADTLLVNVGTGAQVSLMVPEYMVVEGFETRPFLFHNYLLVGATLSGGGAYALVESFFRQVLELFGASVQVSLYETMERALQKGLRDAKDTSVRKFGHFMGERPSHTTLQVSPKFFGTRQSPQERGAIMNIGVDNFTPIDLMMGVLHGVVSELFAYYQLLPSALRSSIQHVVGAGNAIRKSPYMARLMAEVFGQSLLVPRHQEEAAVGAALCGGKAIGCFSSFDEMTSAIHYANAEWVDEFPGDL